MITIQLQGGLGNQLFQIFTTIATALENNDQFFFIYSELLPYGKTRPTYWDSFLKPLKKYTTLDPPYGVKLFRYNETGFEYSPIPKIPNSQPTSTSINDNEIIMLIGYYQSPKYFAQYKDQIFDMIRLNDQIDDIANTVPKWVRNSCSIHFRLDDYLNKQDYHTIMPPHYYINAITQLLLRDPTIKDIFIFNQETDGAMVDAQYLSILKARFSSTDLTFHRINYGTSDWEQLLIMACCKHNIIANSTFSWFGAYFNQSPNRMVFYPASKWFGPKLRNHNLADLFPEDWIPIVV